VGVRDVRSEYMRCCIRMYACVCAYHLYVCVCACEREREKTCAHDLKAGTVWEGEVVYVCICAHVRCGILVTLESDVHACRYQLHAW